MSITTLSHEMDVERQKLTKNCDFEVSISTLSHEMDVERQKLTKNCDFFHKFERFRTKRTSNVQNCGKITIFLSNF